MGDMEMHEKTAAAGLRGHEAEPGLEGLRAEVVQMRARILDVLVKIDHMRLQAIPRIEADYQVKVGYMENRLLEAQIRMRRSKRRLELAQMAANERKPFDPESLEARLDAEFDEWERQLREAVEGYMHAVESRNSSRTLSPELAREAKRLHRLLVKRLHPDVNPGQTPEEANLFEIAQKAYARGDVDTLRSLVEVLEADAPDAFDGDEDSLSADLVVMRVQLESHMGQLESLEKSFPYCCKDDLADPRWVSAKVGELRAQKEACDDARRAYDERYEDLRRKL